MDDVGANLRAILERCEEGRISPAVALMEMLIETEDDRVVTTMLEQLVPASSPRAREILELRRANPSGCARVAAMLRSSVDTPPRDASIEEGVAFCKRLFDWSVGQSEEASVALYSLGNPALLEAATREIVDVLQAWGSLGVTRRALDIGCGIGRMEEALASKLGAIQGIDVSEAMVAAARRRCAGFPNVTISTSSGLDLGAYEDASFDLVFAVDTFPYLVQSGMPLVALHFEDVARVLRAGGEFIVLEFSYRNDAEADGFDVDSLARTYGFEVLVRGERPFALWNGAAFRMRTTKP